MQEILNQEITTRCINDGNPAEPDSFEELSREQLEAARQDPANMKRDTYIRKHESNQRMKMNQTIDLGDMPDEDHFNTTRDSR